MMRLILAILVGSLGAVLSWVCDLAWVRRED